MQSQMNIHASLAYLIHISWQSNQPLTLSLLGMFCLHFLMQDRRTFLYGSSGLHHIPDGKRPMMTIAPSDHPKELMIQKPITMGWRNQLYSLSQFFHWLKEQLKRLRFIIQIIERVLFCLLADCRYRYIGRYKSAVKLKTIFTTAPIIAEITTLK